MDNKTLILPKNRVNIAGKTVFFLAGPIKGGGDWQKKAIELLNQALPDAYVVCPKRYNAALGISDDESVCKPFERQTYWERYYLKIASQQGCVIFWLPEEDTVEPRNDGSPYGRDSYGEIGEWRATLKYVPGTQLVLGAEPNFPGLEQIIMNFRQMINPNFSNYVSLEETIQAAVTKLTITK